MLEKIKECVKRQKEGMSCARKPENCQENIRNVLKRNKRARKMLKVPGNYRSARKMLEKITEGFFKGNRKV